MKVKCINRDGWVACNRKFLGIRLRDKEVNGPKYGDTLTVVDEEWDEGEKFYHIMEWPIKDNCGWQADQFKPIGEVYEKISFEQIKEGASIN